MCRIEFAKLQCGGNDFILVDLRRCDSTLRLSDLAKRICRRRTSVGADGLLVVEPCKNSEFSLLYFNRNGTEARFCGNGLLCAGRWIHENGDRSNPIRFVWKDRKYEVQVGEDSVKTELPPPRSLKLDLHLQSGGIVSYVVVGVPHVVMFETELDQIDVDGVGRRIRFDSSLMPEGANVHFCQQVDRDKIRLRTYERGVETETLSCGSGAAAASYIAYRKNMVDGNVKVLAPGGDLSVHIDSERMFLEGKPVVVFEGVLERL